MSGFQVLFSGEIISDANPASVRANLAKELGIDSRKVEQLFSGRTVVIKSELREDQALEWQIRLSNLGAVCRVKDLVPKVDMQYFAADNSVHNPGADRTLKDITAAHRECPRCGYMQLDASHCTRCGIDLVQARKQRQKEDAIIEKRIRELRDRKKPEAKKVAEDMDQPHGVLMSERRVASGGDKRPVSRVVGWLRKR